MRFLTPPLPTLVVAGLLAATPAARAEPPDACRAAEAYRPGPLATATAADRERFAGRSAGDCLALLYTEKSRRDPDATRRCCLVTGDCNRELAVLFANGWGVTRDYDAAAWFLCRAGEEMAPFEQEGMLEHLRTMRAASEPEDLDYCTQVTSGAGMTFCARIDFERAEADWERRLAIVAAKLAPPPRAALAPLREAAERFADLEGGFLADSSRGGTMYPSQALGERQAAFESFVAALERLVAARAPVATGEELARADRALNAAYRKAMAGASDESGRAVLRDAQRAWIVLRDRWQELYRLRWQGVATPPELDREVATVLSDARAAELLASLDAP